MTLKEKRGIKSISLGDKIYRKLTYDLYSGHAHFKNNLASDEEREECSAYEASQLGLICEYYLKGLLIPNININLPEDIKMQIGVLTEEEELQIILADPKIRNNPKFKGLTKQQWRTLNSNSIKSLGHSLISLIGTKTLPENYPIRLREDIRERIIWEMNYPEQRMSGFTVFERSYSEFENKVERHIESENVSDAFPRGRYSIFDDYEPNVEYLANLVKSIRKAIPYQYENAVEIIASENNANTMIGKFIFPDFESDILLYDGKKEPTRIINIKKAEKKQHMGLPIELQQKSGERVLLPEELHQPELYLSNWKENERWRIVGYAQIAYNPNLSVFALKYVQEGEEKQLAIIDGEPTHLWVKENNQSKENLNTDEER